MSQEKIYVPPSPEKSFGEKVYTDVNQLGLFLAFIGAIGGTLTGFGLIIYALYCAFHKPSRTSILQGKVTSVKNCSTSLKSGYSCYNIEIEYTIDDKKQIYKVQGNKENYVLNETVTLYYDPIYKSNISLFKDDCRSSWPIFMFIGFIVIIFSWIVYYVVKRFRFAQTLVTANFGYNLLRG